MLFSERYGYKKIREAFQIESLDEVTRTQLWNAYYSMIYYDIDYTLYYSSESRHGAFLEEEARKESWERTVWLSFFKKSVNQIPKDLIKHTEILFFDTDWFTIFDFIEFVLENVTPYYSKYSQRYTRQCAKIFQAEKVAYRIVEKRIVPVTSEKEVKEIEAALDKGGLIQEHLDKALDLFADRDNPNYSNSYEESLKAVEALARKIVGKDKLTLGQALTAMDKLEGFEFHSALGEGYKKIYGFANDVIRHAKKDGQDDEIDIEDARYMLISCSAFINYLFVKAEKAGIELDIS